MSSTLSVASYNLGPGKRKVEDLQVLAGVAAVVAVQEAGDQGGELDMFANRTPGWDAFRSTAKAGMGAVCFVADTTILADAELHMHLAVPARWVGPKGAGPTTAKAKCIARLSGFVDGQPLHILDTHVIASWTKSKKALVKDEWEARRAHVRDHVDAIVDLAADLEGTVVLAADLNGPPSHALLKPLHAAGFLGWSSTPTLGRRSVDQVLVRSGDGSTVASDRVVGGLTSDHKARVTTISLPAVLTRPTSPPPKETAVKFVTTAQWGANDSRNATPASHPIGATEGITFHWVGPGRGGAWAHSRCAHMVQAIERHHEYGNGWGDIAYNLLVCPHGYVYEGRGANVRSSANGGTASNASHYAICYLGGVGDPFTEDAKQGFRDGVAYLRAKGNAGHKVNGHRDHKATSCPGDTIYRWLQTENFSPRVTESEEDDMALLDEKLYPNQDDSPDVLDLLRRLDKFTRRTDARLKALGVVPAHLDELRAAVDTLPEGATKAQVKALLDSLDATIQIVVNEEN